MTRPALILDGKSLSLDVLAAFANGEYAEVQLAPEARQRVQHARDFVDRLLTEKRPIYGVNTGFGRLASVPIDTSRLDELQANLIRSHCCGVGEPLPVPLVRLAMLLRANSLCRGHSGVRQDVIDTYLGLLNHGITPIVPRKGSVGASGDLAPLSHVALTVIGEGEVIADGRRMEAAKAMAGAGVAPVTLQAKEGLALINGTQFIQAAGALALIQARKLLTLADLAGALTLECLRGTDRAFDARIAALRPHPGHAHVASNLRWLLADSQIRASHLENDPRVQDAYSLRCMPQVHGASRDALAHVLEVLEREFNAVTDNPLLFPDEGDVISGGNFHGQPLALALDYAAIACAELANISERRIESLVNPDLSALPAFLSGEAGLNSGMMIAQVTAAALVSENKTLCHPASVDSIPTSANKEDHVSMGMWSGMKLLEVVANVRHVLEIELLCGRFAIEYHRPLRSSAVIEELIALLAAQIPPLVRDRITSVDMQAVASIVAGQGVEDILKRIDGSFQAGQATSRQPS